MSRGKQGVFTYVAALATVATMAVVSTAAAVETSGPAGATDDRAPEPVTNLEAFPGAGGVELSWDLSASDLGRQSPTGTDFTSGGTFTSANDVAGYEVSRNGELIETVPAGETSYVDELAAGTSISYAVVAVDAAGNRSEPAVALASLGPPPVAQFTFQGLATGEVPASVDCDVAVDELLVDISPCSSVLWENLADDEDADLIVASTVSGDGFVINASLDPTNTWRTTYSMVIPVAGDETLNIGFDPDAVGNIDGTYSGSLSIRTNDPETPSMDVPLTAVVTGGLGVPDIQVTPVQLAFSPRQPVNTTATRELTVANVGGEPLIGSIAFGPSTSPSYTTSASLTINQAAGDSRVITVSFTPTTPGTHRGSLVFTTNDPDEETVTVDFQGTAVLDSVGPGVVTGRRRTVQLTFPNNFLDPTDTTQVNDFIEDFKDKLARDFGIARDRIRGVTVVSGSIIVTFDVAPSSDPTEPTADAVVTNVVDTYSDTTAPETAELISSYGAIDAVTDQSTDVTLYPQDEQGDVIVGWFTREGTQVDFDDFFAFADHFGLNTVDPEFDDLYDIYPADLPDGSIDFDDFFRFADDFGKNVVNAEEIQAVLP